MIQKSVIEAQSQIATRITRGNMDDFCDLMSREHRTLQQNFTRLCLRWLELCASESYLHDLRNEASHDIAKRLLESESVRQDYGDTPSNYLPFI